MRQDVHEILCRVSLRTLQQVAGRSPVYLEAYTLRLLTNCQNIDFSTVVSPLSL